MTNSPSEAIMWQAVIANDNTYDGQFVLAVKTTGIYCRPSCTARQPKRKNVEFFPSNSEAESNGYRACKRCKPDQQDAHNPQAALIEAVCRYLDENAIHKTVTLQQLGDQFQHSPFYLQRTFKAVMGITPKQYASSVRMKTFKTQLREGDSVTEAIYAAGYSSNSRLYERAAAQLGMIPSVYQQGGVGQVIAYAVADSPLGQMVVAATERGLCAVRLGDDGEQLVAELREEFNRAVLVEAADMLQETVQAIVQHLSGDLPDLDLPLDLQATAFQKRVWQALRDIPYGETRSYGAVAEAMGAPRSARAVGNACASNPVAIVVPCHRVVRGNGEMGNYRWGIERKKRLIEQEKQLKP